MKVSIITVTYNAGAHIERTVASVESQTYADVEHIIVDGASKDDTIAVVKKHGYVPVAESKDAKRRYVSEKDGGLYDAMNKGIALATGRYLCFLNAGDTLHDSSTLQHVADASDGGKAGVVYGDTDIVDSQGHFLRHRRLAPPQTLTWRSFLSGMLVCHQAFYVNRSIAQTYDLTYRFSADFDWCIRCLKEGADRGMANVYVHEPVADYLNEGMTTANHKASLKERFSIMCKHYGTVAAVAVHAWFIVRALLKK